MDFINCCLMYFFASKLNINTTHFVCKQKDIASETGGLEAMPQIKLKQKRNIKQNLQSFGFSSPNFDCQKERKKYYENVKDSIVGLPC